MADPLCNGLLNLSIGFPGTAHEMLQSFTHRILQNNNVTTDFFREREREIEPFVSCSLQIDRLGRCALFYTRCHYHSTSQKQRHKHLEYLSWILFVYYNTKWIFVELLLRQKFYSRRRRSRENLHFDKVVRRLISEQQAIGIMGEVSCYV